MMELLALVVRLLRVLRRGRMMTVVTAAAAAATTRMMMRVMSRWKASRRAPHLKLVRHSVNYNNLHSASLVFFPLHNQNRAGC
jgi:hypothetical protein